MGLDENNPIGIDLANTQTLDNTLKNALVPNIDIEEMKLKPGQREAVEIVMDDNVGLEGVVDIGGDSNFLGGENDAFDWDSGAVKVLLMILG